LRREMPPNGPAEIVGHGLVQKKRRHTEKTMFDKKSLDAMFSELRDNYELEPEWEDIQRDAHLGIARSDGGVDLGDIDPRVAEVLKKHNPS